MPGYIQEHQGSFKGMDDSLLWDTESSSRGIQSHTDAHRVRPRVGIHANLGLPAHTASRDSAMMDWHVWCITANPFNWNQMAEVEKVCRHDQPTLDTQQSIATESIGSPRVSSMHTDRGGDVGFGQQYAPVRRPRKRKRDRGRKAGVVFDLSRARQQGHFEFQFTDFCIVHAVNNALGAPLLDTAAIEESARFFERHPRTMHSPSECGDRDVIIAHRALRFAGFQLRRVRAGSVADLYTHQPSGSFVAVVRWDDGHRHCIGINTCDDAYLADPISPGRVPLTPQNLSDCRVTDKHLIAAYRIEPAKVEATP